MLLIEELGDARDLLYMLTDDVTNPRPRKSQRRGDSAYMESIVDLLGCHACDIIRRELCKTTDVWVTNTTVRWAQMMASTCRGDRVAFRELATTSKDIRDSEIVINSKLRDGFVRVMNRFEQRCENPDQQSSHP